MIYENTGEDVTCLLCETPEFWECGHLVAGLDRHFCECVGGELFDREHEFKEIIERGFLPSLKAGTSPTLSSCELTELWETASLQSFENEEYIDFDGYVFQCVLTKALRDAGAIEPEGAVTDPGGPGMTSSVTLLFAEKPQNCMKEALVSFRAELDVN
jgi:hypothetical protein